MDHVNSLNDTFDVFYIYLHLFLVKDDIVYFNKYKRTEST